MKKRARERLRVHLRLIDDAVAPTMQRYAEHIECRPGCGDCCHQSFEISELEGALVAEGVRELEPAQRDGLLERARGYRAGARQACPALSDAQECLIYAHRPRICRKYGIPLWDPQRPQRVTTCPKNFRGVRDIDTELVVEPQAAWAEDWIELRQELDLGSATQHSIAHWMLADTGDEVC